MLRSTLLITLALAFTAPVAAAAPSPTGAGTFEGDEFQYKSRLIAGDNIQIEGKFLKAGERFSYVLKPSGVVEGFAGSTPVRFRVTRAERDRIADRLKVGIERTFAQASSRPAAAR